MSNCTYRFKDASGKEVVITGQDNMKAFLADGGLKMLMPEWEGIAEPSETPQSPLDAHAAVMDAARAGTATPEQVKASFASVVNNAEAIKAELSAKTKAELLKSGGSFVRMRYGNDKKAVVVDAVYDAMIGEYTLGQGVSYGMGKNSYENAVKRLVDAIDAEALADFAQSYRDAVEESKQRAEKFVEAIKNPQSLDDFRTLLNVQMRDGKTRGEAFLTLTPEQRIRYDELEAEATREAREARKRAAKTEVRAAGQTTGGQIIATKHTRDGYDLFVVQLADRLGADDYKTVLASAKRMGGWYSSFRGNGAIPGFQFKDRESADAFLKLAGGDTADAKAKAEQRRDVFSDDRSQTAVERLREMADRMDDAADEQLNRDRKANTARRARFASAAINAAESEKALAKTMRNIAQAIADGKARFLDAVRTKTQVEALSGYVRTAKDNELRSKYPSYADQEKRKGEPATAETADFAEFPSFRAYRSDLASLARQMIAVDGTKKLGQKLMSVADDVTDAYMEFAKQPENLDRLSTLSMRRGDDVKAAIFQNRESAERAIRRSGLTGKAIVLPEKRGVNWIIMSPSEAMNQKIWKGDGDKLITLTADFGNELVEAIGRRGNKHNGLSVPWQFQTAYDRRKALSRIGIETPSEFRSALREFIGLQVHATANKVREMELKMVGRKPDGLDFFPTPAAVADQMVEAADITPDMAVLEPSAGMAHIADRIREAGAEPDVAEFSSERRELLQEKGYNVVGDDFMAIKPREFFTYGDVFRAPDGTEGIMRGSGGMGSSRVGLRSESGDFLGWFNRDELTGIAHRGTESGYDRIIMNPPFSNRRDAEHVRHAYDLLKPGGRIVAIMGEGVFFGQDRKAQEFRDWLESVGGTSEKLPEGSFLDPSLPVNTGVNARMVVIDRPASEATKSDDAPSVLRTDAPDTQPFREWFAGSKMKDKDGEPLLFMHGTPAAFDSGKLGTSSSHTSSGLGHFFTRDRATAERYADGGNIYEGWLRIENPYVMPLEEAQAFDDVQDSAARRKELQKQGYDGVVILDDQGKQWATVAFEPWQFKSTDNNGNFDEFEDGFRLRDPRIAFRDTSTMRDSPAVPREQAEDFIRRFVAEYPAAPKIVLAESFYQLPEDIQSDALEQGSGPTRAKGALKNGKAYVVLNTHTSMADLEASVFHEVLGHAGIRKLLGPAFAQELNKMFIGLGGYSKLYQIMSRRGMGRQFEGYYDAVQRAREKNPEVWTEFLASSILTEEVFAHIAEQKNAKALRDRFMALVGMVRDWLRRNGFARLASLGESDIVFLLQRARAGLKNGSGVIRDGVTIGETVIVDAEGRPVAKKGSPDYEMLKAVSERMGLRETNGPTVFSNSLPEEGKPGEDTRMDDANNVAGKQAPTPAGDVEAGGATSKFAWPESGKEPRIVFHNSDNPDSFVVREEGGGFGGIFAGPNAGMHGEFKHAVILDPDKVMTHYDFKHEVDYDTYLEASPEYVIQRLRGKVAQAAGYAAAEMKDETGVSVLVGPGPKTYPLQDGEGFNEAEARIYQEWEKRNNESPASASSDAPTVFRTVTPEQLNAYAQPRGQAAKEVVGNLIAAFREPSSKIFNVLHKTISTPLHKASISKDYDRVFRLAQDYQNDIARFAAGPADAAPRMLPSYDSIRQAFSRLVHGNKYTKFKGAVADAIFEGTLAGEDVTSGRVWTDAELRDRYDMTDDQIGLYREARDAIDASLDSAAAGLAWQAVKKYIPDMKGAVRHEPADAEKIIDEAMRQAEDELREVARYQAEVEKDGAIPKGTAEKTLNKAKSIAEARVAAEGIFARADALKAGGYAPLMRFGKYAVDAVRKLEDGTEERITFMRFESELEAKMAAQKIRKLHPDAEVKRSIISEEAWKIYKGVDPELVSLFAESLDGVEGLSVKEDVLQEWYRNAVSERSSFKRMMHRKGTDGFDRDITRVLASFITSNSRLAARQFNMGDISEALADMNERKVSGDVLDDATGLKEYIDNPEKPFKAMKGMMFAFFLGGSVASAALNLTQPMMMTFPYLSQYGARKAGAALRGAAAEAAKGSVSDKELGRALSRATKDGIVDPQQIHHLYHESLRSFLAKLPLGEGLQERAQGLMTLWGMMFGATENFNRRLTFIAAYRMAKDDPSLGKPYDFAAKAVEETQGIYNDANIPNWARGNGSFGALGVAAFTFKQYSIGYVELLIRLAKSGKNGRKGAAIMLGTLVLMSGMQGAPGADDLEDVIDTVAQYMGYTGNSRLALRKSLESGLGNVFAQETAKEMAHIIMYGGLSVLPGDLASRTGLGNLFPATAIAKPSEQNRGSQIAEIFGPPLGMANQVLDATLAMESGAGALGVASAFAPIAVRNWIKAYDMASTGQYRDTKGRKVVDVTAGDVALKAIGIQPTVVSDDTKSARLVNLTKQRITQVKSAISSLKAQGIADRNPEMKARADAMVKEWNEKNPDATIRINDASILKRVKEINTERRARLLKAMPKDFRATAAESYSD